MREGEANNYSPLDPNVLVRRGSDDEWRYLGLKRTAVQEAIDDGLLEPPHPLNEDGRAQAWFGFQVNRYHEKIRELRPQWEARRKTIAVEQARKREATEAEKATKRRAKL